MSNLPNGFEQIELFQNQEKLKKQKQSSHLRQSSVQIVYIQLSLFNILYEEKTKTGKKRIIFENKNGYKYIFP